MLYSELTKKNVIAGLSVIWSYSELYTVIAEIHYNCL